MKVMDELTKAPVVFLALGSLFTVLGAIGLAGSAWRREPISECLIHPIRNRISAKETAGHAVSKLELGAHYLYITGLLALLTWLVLLLLGN